MRILKLRDISFYEIGHSIKLSGAIYTDNKTNYVALYPSDLLDEVAHNEFVFLEMSIPEWERFLKQTDTLAFVGPTKAILRKSQRIIDQKISWEVYRRDEYTCRYCGRNNVPLSVDHIDLWEDGGITLPENLLSACRPCNKKRGRTPYREWIESDMYKKKSIRLTEEQKIANIKILENLQHLESLRNERQRSR